MDADSISGPQAAKGGILPCLYGSIRRRYYQLCGGMRKFTTAYAAEYRKSPLHMRQYAEIHRRISGSIRKVTTTYTAVCGKLQPHMRHSTDSQTHVESYVYMF